MSDVVTVEHFWIPMPDGTQLAARLWAPADYARERYPAILEYIPYRKRDGTRGRDEPMHGFFAAQGYVALRVDMRGSGESDGHMADEYLPQELQDACVVIDWASRQSWCTGDVGMMGKSWGGFNCLQTAALRPPALKAVLTVCSTDDRYADDIHFMGGALLNDNLWWGTIMLAYQARPADPELVGDGWRSQWLDRLDKMPFFPALWLEHQARDDYWRHGSICEDWSAIQIPVFAVGGWADAYTNAIPRMLEKLTVPRLGLIGPWAHIYAQDGKPGPAIGFLQEATRWWDHWLKGIDSGVMAEPMLRAYIEEGGNPGFRAHAPGRWVAEAQWPSPAISHVSLNFGGGALTPTEAPYSECTFRSPAWTGSGCGEWMGTGVEGEAPLDQRFDDGLSLTFDSGPIRDRIELLGAPEIELEMSSDRPTAQIAARLCDVAPDGSSRRISYGVLNLTHHEGHSEPKPLAPGETFKARLKLNDCGYALEKGHVLRLALSTAYWPLIWPAADAATLTLRAPGILMLPARRSSPLDGNVGFDPPVAGPAAPSTKVGEGRMTRSVSFDLVTGVSTYITDGQGGLFGEGAHCWDDIGTVVSHDLRRELTIGADDPLSAHYALRQTYVMGREGWRIRIETDTAMHASATEFFLSGEVRGFENDALVHQRELKATIPRNGV